MPLLRSKSKAAFAANVKTEIAAGKPQKQAVAIAYAQRRKAGGKGMNHEIAPLLAGAEVLGSHYGHTDAGHMTMAQIDPPRVPEPTPTPRVATDNPIDAIAARKKALADAMKGE